MINKSRAIIHLFSFPKRISFSFQCGKFQSVYNRNWVETYNCLKNSPFWKDRINPNLSDNDVTNYKFYENVLHEDEKNKISLLNGEEIIYWSQSSGTTGARKLFPVTKVFKDQFQVTTPPFLNLIMNKYKNVLKEPVLYLAGTNPAVQTASGIDIGFMSNYNYRNMPSFVKESYVLPDEVLVSDEYYGNYAHLYVLAKNITGIFAVTPLSVEGMMRKIIDNWDDNLLYLKGEKKLPTSLPGLNISSERLSYLQKLEDKVMKNIWSNLGFLCCWKSSVCAYQLEAIEGLTKGIDIIDATYSATEGWFNVPFPQVDGAGGPIHPSGVLLEFRDSSDNEAKLLKPWELEVGKKYEVFITNKMGFVRYQIFDVILCTGFYKQSPIVEFSHKSSAQISLGLVTLAEEELLKASKIANLDIQLAVFGPDSDYKGICVYTKSQVENISSILTKMDDSLKELNVKYKYYREKGVIAPLSYTVIGEAFWLKEKHAQTKPKFLYQQVPS